MKYYVILFLVVAVWTIVPVPRVMAQGMRMPPEQRANRLKDSLDLSDTQVEKIIQIYKDADRKRAEAFASGSEDRQARMKVMRAIMDSTDAKIETLLIPAQKAKYEGLKKQRQERGQGSRRRPSNE